MKSHWDAQLYDSKHSFVSHYGNDLLDLMQPKAGEHILDLGCGTGDLTKKLYDCQVNVVGIDASETMIQQAKEKYPDIPFLLADAKELPYANMFDGVFSNAVLHWVKPPRLAMRSIFKSLKRGGRFVCEFGGQGNVKTITDELMKQIKRFGYEYDRNHFPWYFPSIGEYTRLLEEVGFYVRFAELIDRPTRLDGEDGFKNWMKMFGSSLFNRVVDVDDQRKIIEKVEQQLKSDLYKGDHWVADYKRIRVLAIKK